MVHAAIKQEELTGVLAAYRGGTAYWLPLVDKRGKDVGNNGDVLIELGSRKFCEEAGIVNVALPEKADVLIVRGGGRMSGYQLAYNLIAGLWNNFPNKPLIVLPSSYYFPEKDFAHVLRSRSAPTHIFCREERSFEHISPQLPPYVQVLMGHDMAFCLSVDDFGARHIGEHILAVERNDYEHPSNDLAKPSSEPSPLGHIKAGFANKLPRPVARSLRNRLRPETPSPEFKLFVETTASEYVASQVPIRYGDVSNQRRYSQADFYNLVKASKLTVTTRLHVGILSALLGIDTKLIAGPYHKLRGIYSHSMSDMSHVELVDSIW